jgi:hypothetical protein
MRRNLVHALWQRHRALETELAREAQRPLPDDTPLKTLKKRKLSVRDRLAALMRQATMQAA